MRKNTNAWLLCLLLCWTVSAWATFSTEMDANRTITADMRVEKGPANRMFQLCVGAGRANEGLRAQWQHQLAYVQKECGFRYLRFHGLLCDDMGVYSQDWANGGTPIYNWQYIDHLFDFMQSINIKPFVEIGFMPSALASGPSTIFWWKGNVTPPNDYTRWEGLITALLTHWKERYGEDEVATWYFEVWNEPNLDGFWIKDKKGKTDAEFAAYAQEEYFKLYASTAKAVKAVSPRFRVGGPATAGCAWVPETIDFCVKNNVPIDFVSTHHYCVEAGYLDETGTSGTVFSQDPNAMSGAVHGVRRQIAKSARPNLELHFTEWSASYTPSDPIHDSYHSAAFILNSIKRSESAVQSMSYWVFTDIFEEAGPRMTPFHGGFGLLNSQGINKPAFYAYQFLNRLGPVELKTSDEASWITKDEKGGVQALFWDFTITHPGKKVLNQDFYKRDLPPAKTTAASLHISGLKPGRYAMTLYKVGYRVNDAYATYMDLGSPSQLTRQQAAFIKEKNDGTPLERTTIEVRHDGVFVREYEVRENDVCLVTLSPL